MNAIAGESGPADRVRAMIEALAAPLRARLAKSDCAADTRKTLAPAQPRKAATPSKTDPAQIDAAAQALAAGDSAPVEALLATLKQDTSSATEIAEQLFGPVARRLGVMWEEDSATFGAVGAGLEKLSLLFEALRPAQRGDNGRAVLCTCDPRETHVFGLSVVGNGFAEAGWTVISMPRAEAASVLEAVATDWIDVLAITISWTEAADDVARLVPLVRRASLNRDIKVLVGGGGLKRDPDLGARLGADATASSVDAALAQAWHWVASGDRAAAAHGSAHS